MVNLESVLAFRGLDESDLRLLRDAAQEIRLPPKAYLYRYGDAPDGFYIVQSGTLSRPWSKPRRETSLVSWRR
jgi:CRP-like cAMP-binding protein